MPQSVFRVAAVQAAPAFLDLTAGVAKAVALIADAKRRGAQLIAFPECWIPGYPWWIWLDSPAWGMQFVRRYHENSPTNDGAEIGAIRAAAREHGMWVGLGYTERDGGSLYIAQMLIDPAGEIVGARRKLKPTHVERTVFGDGDGSDLRVHATPLGRIGMLSCWEHLNPLNKYVLYAQHEQIHLGAWPSFSLYEGAAYALGPQLNGAVSQVYAAEGQAFVVAASGTVSNEMVELMCDTPAKRELLKAGGGAAMIYAPDGRPLCEPLPPDAEGLLIADVDLGAISIAKSAADPVGHYARADVARVVFNSAPLARVEHAHARGPGSRSFAFDPPDARPADAVTAPDSRVVL